MTAYERLQLARAMGRPTASDYIAALFTDSVELHGDRAYADDPSVTGGIGLLSGTPVTFIGIERGHDTMERIRYNFGCPKPEGYRKARRLMLEAEKFGRPVVTFVDTSGAACGIGAEERGQGQAIAENLTVMAGLRVPIVSIVIGEGGSGGALGIALADRVWMLENAAYSVISPEGCASILWKDAARAPEAAERLHFTAEDMLRFCVAERIIEERFDEFPAMCASLGQALSETLGTLSAMTADARILARAERFRKFSPA